MHLRTAAVLLALALAGCAEPADPPAPPPKGDPELGRASAAPGEVVVRGELSPATHGPYDLDGRYRVAFEQQAPEDPGLDFAAQTSFVARLDERAGIRGPGSVRLFRVAARTGERTLELRGRYFVEVAFGDFPYVIRFTPRD